MPENGKVAPVVLAQIQRNALDGKRDEVWEAYEVVKARLEELLTASNQPIDMARDLIAENSKLRAQLALNNSVEKPPFTPEQVEKLEIFLRVGVPMLIKMFARWERLPDNDERKGMAEIILGQLRPLQLPEEQPLVSSDGEDGETDPKIDDGL